MENSSLLQLPEELLVLWHLHRTELLISAGVVVAIVRLALHWRGKKHPALLAPLAVPLKDSKDIGSSLPPVERRQESTVPAAAPQIRQPRRIRGLKPPRSLSSPQSQINTIQPVILYFTLGGSTRAYAETLRSAFPSDSPNILPPQVHDLTEIDYDDYFTSLPTLPAGTSAFYLLLIPSYDIDTELSNFLSHLRETHHDFRIDTAPLSPLAAFSVFGLGDRTEWPTEADGFCSQAIEVDRWMAKLTGGKRGYPLGTGDSKKDAGANLQEWAQGITNIMTQLSAGLGLGEGVQGSGDALESGDEDSDSDPDPDPSLPRSPRRRPKPSTSSSQALDLEDIKPPEPVDFTTPSSRASASVPSLPKPMVPVSSPTHASLTKQGYTIVGTHSGVKLCRWTKSALRGRGSCYKFSFYGIASHRCMEATPALACSNKCVFCWRHGTNPVGTSWRWQVDPPGEIFDGIKAGHYKKIKMLRGIPGVRAERFKEGMEIRHCALSLVGEPIFYPHINELLGMLHGEGISSFLVCNAQHPEHLERLGPVTQLYVSIDAADRETLRRIDRPLHRDFWERFLRCMDILYAKRGTHRTVFRLTLVKGFNASHEEVRGYADLVERARPSFVEVKGVTYCVTSTAAGAGLTMANVPFYEEVQGFVMALKEELGRRGLDYGIGAEHAHSCCILLAEAERYYRPSGPNGERRWHTLIDYAKFFQLLRSGKVFGPEDYVSDEPTPEWALWGNGGFDPRDQRVDRKGRPKVVEVKEVKQVEI